MEYKDNPPPYSAAAPSGASAPPPGFQLPSEVKQPYTSAPEPQPEPQPQQHRQTATTTTTQIIVNPGVVYCFGPNPQRMVCPSCQAQITTTVNIEPNTKTHLLALVLCLLGCYCCCCIPYCVDSCQSKLHYCPHCQAFLGSYQD